MTDSDKPRMQRTLRLNVRLNDTLMEQLDALSADLGVPAATIGAMAIGEYVHKKTMEKSIAKAAIESNQALSSGILENFEALFGDKDKFAALISQTETNLNQRDAFE